MEALFKRNIQSNHNYECKMLKQVTSFCKKQIQNARTQTHRHTTMTTKMARMTVTAKTNSTENFHRENVSKLSLIVSVLLA